MSMSHSFRTLGNSLHYLLLFRKNKYTANKTLKSGDSLRQYFRSINIICDISQV